MTLLNSIIQLLLTTFLNQQQNQLEGIWKLKSYDAIQNIKNTPAYVFADEEARKILDDRFNTILTKGQYEFLKDTLLYTDMDGNDIIIRRAVWELQGETIFISEIDREFQREAALRYVDSDSLVISPVINGETAESKMIFIKERDPDFSFVK